MNDSAAADTAVINADPYGAGWLIKMRVGQGAEFDHLLTQAQYEKQIACEGH